MLTPLLTTKLSGIKDFEKLDLLKLEMLTRGVNTGRGGASGPGRGVTWIIQDAVSPLRRRATAALCKSRLTAIRCT